MYHQLDDDDHGNDVDEVTPSESSVLRAAAEHLFAHDNIYEIGSKQIIIERLRDLSKSYSDSLLRIRSKKQMIQLYLDATDQMYQKQKDPVFETYKKKEFEKQKKLRKSENFLEFRISFISDHINSIKKDSTSLAESRRILADQQSLFDRYIPLATESLKPTFIKEYLRSWKYSETILNSDQYDASIKIMVIGKRGVGKSSFINAIRNIDEFEVAKNDSINNHVVARTSSVECTEFMSFYRYEITDIDSPVSTDESSASSSSKPANIYIIDFPGVGTERFPSHDYVDLIEHMDVDAFVYVYQNNLDPMDWNIIEQIGKRMKTEILLVRNKVDLDFESWLANNSNPPVSIDDLSTEQLEGMIQSNWPDFRQILCSRFENNLPKNLCLHESQKKCYFVSSDSYFRNFFDLELLAADLVKQMPAKKSSGLKAFFGKIFF